MLKHPLEHSASIILFTVVFYQRYQKTMICEHLNNLTVENLISKAAYPVFRCEECIKKNSRWVHLGRFSGRRAPEHPGDVPSMADWVTREAYSHEVSSCDFWPGSGSVVEPVFYAYAYPTPEGFQDYPIQPTEAFYRSQMQEFILPYEAMRQTDDPDTMLLAFF